MRKYVHFFLLGCLSFFFNNTSLVAQNCNLDRVAAEFTLLINDICEGEKISVENTTRTNGHGLIMYIMDWGDGTKDTVMQKSLMTHTYTLKDRDPCVVGNVEMQLNLKAIPIDCPDLLHSVQKPVYVTFRPRPKIDATTEICIGVQSRINNLTCPKRNVKFKWDFGDPNSSKNSDTLANPVHDFSAPGVYQVRVEATNVCGTENQSLTIKVVGLPKADFTAKTDPNNGCLPEPITVFKNNSNQWSNTTWEIIPNDTLKWRFTDTIMRLSSRDISIRFFQAGNYVVKLTADNACRMPDVKIDTIKIFAQPQIALEAPASVCDSTVIKLVDLKLKAEGDITRFEWIFENGSPGSFIGKDFGSIKFTKSGKVELKVESPCGNQSTSTQISIGSTAPISLDGNKSTFCQDEKPSQLKAVPES